MTVITDMDKVELLDTIIKLASAEQAMPLKKIKMIRRLKVRRSQLEESLPIWAPLRVIQEVALVLAEENKSFLNNNSSQRTKRQMYSTFHQLLPSKVEPRIMMKVKIKRKVLNKLRNQRTELNST